MDGTDFASFEIKMNLGGVFYDYEKSVSSSLTTDSIPHLISVSGIERH